MDERITKYDHLYKMMAEGSDPEKMHIFGNAERHMFRELVKRDPAMADAWLAMLMPVEWHNYLTEEEAKEIGEHMENQDGTMGYHWDADTFKAAVERLGGKLEDKPYYNMWALWATANMEFSDHGNSIAQDMGGNKASDIPNEKMALSCYRKAVEKLKDPDRPRFVRWYFHL